MKKQSPKQQSPSPKDLCPRYSAPQAAIAAVVWMDACTNSTFTARYGDRLPHPGLLTETVGFLLESNPEFVILAFCSGADSEVPAGEQRYRSSFEIPQGMVKSIEILRPAGGGHA